MSMDFSGSAGAASSFDTITHGQLAFCVLTIRGIKASASGGQYIDAELTVDQGQPYAGRKFWEMIGNPFHQGNSEKYRAMGQIAITRILEAGKGAGPNNPDGYKLGDFSELSGLRVPVKIGVEEGEGGHDDKNRVAEWLTPNPASKTGFKLYEKLCRGEYSPGTKAAPAPAQSGFGGQAQTGGGQQSGGFGSASASAVEQPPATTGFGNSGSGFQQPPADSSGQSGANSGVAPAANQTPTDASASHSEVPGKTPGWLEQAGEQAATPQS